MNILSFFLSLLVAAAPLQREIMDVSGNDWNITLDKDAKWEDDELFLPPVELDRLPDRKSVV